jgi:hypothetical protein
MGHWQPTVDPQEVMVEPIEQAPDWVRKLCIPPDQVAAMRDLVRRHLAGDRSIPVGPWEELEAQLAAEDTSAA